MKEKIAFLFDSGVKLGKSSYEGTISQFEDAMQMHAEEYAKAAIVHTINALGLYSLDANKIFDDFKESLKK